MAIMELLMAAQAGDMITGNGQLEFRGYVLGDNETTFLGSITGWDDLPGIESGNTSRANSHGSWVGRKLANQRVITWNGRFSPPDPEGWDKALRELRNAFSLPLGTEEDAIVIQSIGEKKLCFGAVVARSIPMDESYGYYGANVAIQFECSDPRRYSLNENLWTLELPPVIEVGLNYPLTYPLDYGIEITSSTGTLVNDGDVISPVTLVFSGPATRPALVNKTANTKLEFDITLGESEFLEINTRTGTVMLNGIADRLYTRTARSAPILSFGLMPGENEMQITAEDWDEPASVSISWRDATL